MKRFWAFTAVFNSSTHRIFRASFFPAEKTTETAQSGRLSSAHTAVPRRIASFWLRKDT